MNCDEYYLNQNTIFLRKIIPDIEERLEKIDIVSDFKIASSEKGYPILMKNGIALNDKYNPIEDARFAIFKGAEDELTKEEQKVVDLVVNTFGEYGGKMLERITHEEAPWKFARKGYADNIPSHETITMESIENYYTEKNKEYDFTAEDGLKQYIRDILQ